MEAKIVIEFKDSVEVKKLLSLIEDGRKFLFLKHRRTQEGRDKYCINDLENWRRILTQHGLQEKRSRLRSLLALKAVIGTCICLREPRGDDSLEGFQLDGSYGFTECVNGVRALYVYDMEKLKYLGTCDKKVFDKYFVEV